MTSAGTWPPVIVTQQILELKSLQTLVESCSGAEEYAPHLYRYLVIRSTGLLEAVRDKVVSEYFRATGSSQAHRRIEQGLGRGLGATPKQLLDFIRSIDPDWSEEFKEWLQHDEGSRSNKIGAMVKDRKGIAHGDGTSTSRVQALEWANVAIDATNWFILRFNPYSEL